MPAMIESYELILRLILGAFLGGLIGFERERLSWVAGLRTHMLVCVGATLVMIVSQYGFHEVLHVGFVNLDPSRVAAQVVSGIGFLGAGTILFLKDSIRGLTTAASLWAVAAVGLAVGGGLYLASITTTLLILLILAGIKPIERKFIKKNQTLGLRFSAKNGHLSTTALQDFLSQIDLIAGPTRLQIEKKEDREFYFLIFKATSKANFIKIVEELRHLDGIENIEVVNETIVIT